MTTLKTVSQREETSPSGPPEPFGMDLFDPSLPCWIARAPGRLDVMGGISDYCGGLVMGLTLSAGVRAGVQRRGDGQIGIHFLQHERDARRRSSTWALSNLQADVGWREPDDVAARLRRLGDEWVLPLAGVLHALPVLGHVPSLGDGWTVVLKSELTAPGGLGATGAAQVALIESLSAVFDLQLSPEQVAAVCRHASRSVCGLPSGGMDPMVALLGRSDVLLQLDFGVRRSVESRPVPESIGFVGVDSGVRHRLADDKHRQTRTAAAMGAKIIDEVDAVSMPGAPSIGMCLSKVSPVEYVNSYRDRLPTKIKGADFVARYGELGADAGPVEPDVVYKIRSRTEHHIYENQRCRQFAALLERACAAPRAEWLQAAGQLMNNSHWSYGQRCGLGTIETDLLVNLLQGRGIERGILGVRVSGAGAGGMVTVMVSNHARARETVAEVVDEYQRRSGNKATLYEPGGCGAREAGVRRAEPMRT